MKASPYNRRRAFSLVELLVVIAILTMLLAILLPSLAQVRRQAMRAKCATNLRQIGQAWHGYFGENNDAFYQGIDAQWRYGGKDGSDSPGYRKERPLNRSAGYRAREREEAEIFHCPADRGDPTLRGRSYYDMFGTSYVTNTFLVGDAEVVENNAFLEAINPLLPKMRLSRLRKNHSELVLAGDAPWFYTWQNALAFATDWHGQEFGYNLLYLDGGVDFVTMEPGKNATGVYTTVPFDRLDKIAKEFDN